MGMIQITRDAAGVGRRQQDGLAVLGHQRLVDVRRRGAGRHHALDLVAHRDGGGRVGLGHREVGARGQRTSASMAAARCATVGGDESSAPLPMIRATARTSERQEPPGPRAGTRRDGHRSGAASALAPRSRRAAFRKVSRFFCVAGPSSTAVTRPAGSMTKVVGGAVTP